MAKGAWIGIGGKARKIKNMYIGVGGKARKIKKAWIGVGGKARLFFSSDAVLTYSKEITQSVATSTQSSFEHMLSSANGNHAMVMYSKKADFFNPSLTRSTISYSSSSTQAGNQNACQTSSYNFIAGGGYSTSNDGSVAINEIRAFNSSLTVTNATLNFKLNHSHTATLNNYAFLCGGVQARSGYSAYSESSQAVNNSLTVTTLSNLSTKKYCTTACALGSYVLVMGARKGSGASTSDYTTSVDVYNSSLTKLSNATSLPQVVISFHSAANSNYVVHHGFIKSQSWVGQTVAYNTSLTQTTSLTGLAQCTVEKAAISSNELAIFGGGRYSGSYIATVEYYNPSLTKFTATPLKQKRNLLSGVNFKEYVLFFGGVTGSYEENDNYYDTYTNTVSVYTM